MMIMYFTGGLLPGVRLPAAMPGNRRQSGEVPRMARREGGSSDRGPGPGSALDRALKDDDLCSPYVGEDPAGLPAVCPSFAQGVHQLLRFYAGDRVLRPGQRVTG